MVHRERRQPGRQPSTTDRKGHGLRPYRAGPRGQAASSTAPTATCGSPTTTGSRASTQARARSRCTQRTPLARAPSGSPSAPTAPRSGSPSPAPTASGGSALSQTPPAARQARHLAPELTNFIDRRPAPCPQRERQVHHVLTSGASRAWSDRAACPITSGFQTAPGGPPCTSVYSAHHAAGESAAAGDRVGRIILHARSVCCTCCLRPPRPISTR